MCSAQIARLAADRMNATGLAGRLGLDRFVALTHSEGCGFGGETMYHLLHRTYRGYATHPNVAAALLLEHGCEKVPNDVMKRQFESANLPLDRFGWASVQLDGGIEKALGRVGAWFESALAERPATTRVPAGLGALAVGVLSAGPLDNNATAALVAALGEILAAGGSVLMPEGDRLLADARLVAALGGRTALHATLAYGQPLTVPGLHIVQTDSDHWTENLAGLGACGAQVFLGLVGDTPQQGHPLLPVWQIAGAGALLPGAAEDVDLILSGAGPDARAILDLVVATANGTRQPKANAGGFVDFQLTRGLLGVST